MIEAITHLPPDYAANMSAWLTAACEYTIRPAGGEAVAITPSEGAGTVRRYLNARKVADADTDLTADEIWAFLATRPPFPGRSEQVQLTPSMQAQLDRLKTSTSLADIAQRLSAEVALTEVEHLAAVMRRELPGLFERFPTGSLFSIEVDHVLAHRLAALRVQLQLAIAPDVSEVSGEGITYFGAQQLTGGINFGDAVQPILLTYSPSVAGFAMNAPPGAFVFLCGGFGEDQDLREPRGHLERHFHPAVNAHPYTPGIKVPVEQLTVGDIETLLSWWTARLNIPYSYAADPTRFLGDGGEHDAAGQAAWLFTFERMLGDFAALGSAVNSPGLLRMQAAFDALDKAASLLAGPGADRGAEAERFKQLLDRDRTLPRIHQAFANVPLTSRTRFKQWAADSYQRLYDDIREQTIPHRVTDDGRGVMVGLSGPTDLRLMLWGDYVSELVREARNASHGLLQTLTRVPRRGRARRLLLATNQGEVPNALYDVARVIVFALIADAESLRDRTW